MARNTSAVSYGRYLLLFTILLPAPCTGSAPTTEVAGAKVILSEYEGPATFSASSHDEFKLLIDVVPNGETEPIPLRIQLAATGRDTWPILDVEVRDSNGLAIPVRRAGIEWHILYLTVPPRSATYTVQAVDPPNGPPRIFPEKERLVIDQTTGLQATVCKWHGGRQAALSIRFDDSHPTHLSKAIPILREYGFRGTFMVNPGAYSPTSRRRSAFDDQRDKWHDIARQGDQELANHTAHHRGAENDEDMDREIGEASETIWKLAPNRSMLLALNLGGGTWWTTTRTLRYYLDKYHLFDASSGSLGMDDTYGQRVAAFRLQLDRHIDRRGWCRIHYHSIGDGQAASEANFRAALDIARQHEAELWIAGMADIYKYQVERDGAALSLANSAPGRVVLRLTCTTDQQLYDHPLTLQVNLPQTWPGNDVTVTDSDSHKLAPQLDSTRDGSLLRFAVPPVTRNYVLKRSK